MSEMENTADQLIVIGRGELIAAESLTEFAARGTRPSVTVRTPDPCRPDGAADGRGRRRPGRTARRCAVTGVPAARIGESPSRTGCCCTNSPPGAASLEEAFMELTADSVEYLAGDPR